MGMATLARYEILDELGHGEATVVYRASDPLLRRHDALKVLKPQVARDTAVRERFVRDARALAGVQHPSLVTVLDVGEEADGAFLVAVAWCCSTPASPLHPKGPRPPPSEMRSTH